jgi:phosphoribosyl 1,2-cyclic phosphodiesterase
MLQAKLEFETLEKNAGTAGMNFGDLCIRWCSVHHPGGCFAYRIDEKSTGESLVIGTDIEWQESSDAEKEKFIALCSIPEPAGLLFFDGHFTPENYGSFRNWGHSTWQDGIEIVKSVAKETTEPRLVIIHHAPERDDEILKEEEKRMRQHLETACFGRQRSIFEGTERIEV